MSIHFPDARTLHEHIQYSRFNKALTLIRTIPPGEGNRRAACGLVLKGLKNATHGPLRDNGFAHLITLLIEIGDAGQALAAIDSIGNDSHLSTRVGEFRAQVEKLVERQQTALREGEAQV